jgi:dihydrodipicolinate synthase/N-acetylneuraminate lyase
MKTPSPPTGRPARRTLAGVLAIAHVPFDAHDRIDQADLKREVDWIYAVGADGLGTGMVSEVVRLTADERRQLTESLVELTAGRGAVFASVGAESIPQATAYAVEAERAGCDAVMAVPPMTSRLSAPKLVSYFRAIAESVGVPLIVQDASGYLGHSIPLAVYVELLDRYGPDKIVFKPEAAPLGPNLSALRDATGGRARIFEGSGGILLVDSHRRGIAGTMPGVDLLDGIVPLWRALEAVRNGGRETAADSDAIYRLSLPICAMVAIQMQAGLDGFLAIEKYLLVKRGLFSSARRREPNGWSLDDETAREVDRLFERLADAVAATCVTPS